MILSRLREQTRDLHERVEQGIDLPGRLQSIPAYTALLSRLYGFHSPLELRLATATDSLQLGIDVAVRVKAGLAARDLRSMGWSTSAIDGLPQCDRLPALLSPSRIWGCLYVIEGSTLGGQVITRMVKSRLGLSPENGCAFFAAYNNRTATMWREFCSALASFAENGAANEDEIIAAANETFIRFEEWVTC